VTLTLSKRSFFAHLTDSEYQTQMKAMCREISDEAANDRRVNGLCVLDVKRLLRYSPHHVPESMDKTPAPKVHSCCPEFRVRGVQGLCRRLPRSPTGLNLPRVHASIPPGRLAIRVQLRSRLSLDAIPIQNTRTPRLYGRPLSESWPCCAQKTHLSRIKYHRASNR
jgi:hypothetical protein